MPTLTALLLCAALIAAACRATEPPTPNPTASQAPDQQTTPAAEPQDAQPSRSTNPPAPAQATDPPTTQQRPPAPPQQSEPEQPQAADAADAADPQPTPTRAAAIIPAVPAPDYQPELALSYLQALAGDLGPRASGTEQELAAALYLADTFRQLGYEAEIHDFTYTAPQRFARLITPDGVAHLGFHFSGSADHHADAPLTRIPGHGEAADFAAVNARGKITLVNRGVIEFSAKAAHAVDAGATALIIANQRASDSFGGTLGLDSFDIPVLLVSRETGDLLDNWIDQTLTIPALPPMNGESRNVIARKPDGVCRVIVGGHYDTVPDVVGANDNASGAALTLALAELWSDHPAAQDLCFVGFGAEEVGLHGSAAHVRTLRDRGQLADVTAMLNLDAVGGDIRPLTIYSERHLRALVLTAAAQLGADATFSSQRVPYSDHASFQEAGVPIVFTFAPGGLLHTPLDNLDRFHYQPYAEIGALNHAILTCLLARAGSPVISTVPCAPD